MDVRKTKVSSLTRIWTRLRAVDPRERLSSDAIGLLLSGANGKTYLVDLVSHGGARGAGAWDSLGKRY
jgi:hypothetical protein